MTASAQERVGLLARVPVLADLPAEDLEQISEAAHPRRFAAGEIIFREGDASNTCYIVRSGRARAVREHADGRQLALATFGQGDIFGELAMFDDERRSATVEAIEPLETLAILGNDLRRCMEQRPQLAIAIAASLARRLRATNERLSSQSFQTVQSRVATVLGQLVEQAGTGRTDVAITVTQAEVAQLAGSSRESASRFLAVLERAGVISQGRGRLTVHDPEALRNYVY
jgi:CRP/FNR family transcriptional regulator, cyclic AMP receptor protein